MGINKVHLLKRHRTEKYGKLTPQDMQVILVLVILAAAILGNILIDSLLKLQESRTRFKLVPNVNSKCN